MNDLYTYDTKSNIWTEIQATGEIPSGRGSHSMTLIEDIVYVFGGSNGDEDNNDLYILNINTWVWEKHDRAGKKPT